VHDLHPLIDHGASVTGPRWVSENNAQISNLSEGTVFGCHNDTFHKFITILTIYPYLTTIRAGMHEKEKGVAHHENHGALITVN